MGRLFEHRLDDHGEVAAYGNDGQGRLLLVLCLSELEERVVTLDQIELCHLLLAGFFLSLLSDLDLGIRCLESARSFLPIATAESVHQIL